MRARIATLIAVAGISLGGCAYNGLGVGLGYGDPYGYGPYGGYGMYDPYFDYAYGRPGYGYAQPYGWYGGYYYPGTGYYVYDQYRNPFYWTDVQRHYWESQPHHTSWTRENWSKFVQHRTGTATTSGVTTTSTMSEPTTTRRSYAGRSYTTRSTSHVDHSPSSHSSHSSFSSGMRHLGQTGSNKDD